jgi:predicted AAA+ superfamily ATPase
MDSFDYLDYLKKNKISYDNTSLSFSDYKKRFIYNKIINRLNIIYGLRGTGKTTILFQKYLETKNQKIYFNSDELKVLKLNLLELIEKTIYLFGDKTEIFIDEINSIEGWADIIKIAHYWLFCNKLNRIKKTIGQKSSVL